MTEKIYASYEIEDIAESTELELLDPDLWQDFLNKNMDDVYGAGIMNYACRWAKAVQHAIEVDGYLFNEVIEQLGYDADIEGVTGYMYGAAVQVLSATWVYGEDLRIWHNSQYGHEGDGVVNPAILTIG